MLYQYESDIIDAMTYGIERCETWSSCQDQVAETVLYARANLMIVYNWYTSVEYSTTEITPRKRRTVLRTPARELHVFSTKYSVTDGVLPPISYIYNNNQESSLFIYFPERGFTISYQHSLSFSRGKNRSLSFFVGQLQWRWTLVPIIIFTQKRLHPPRRKTLIYCLFIKANNNNDTKTSQLPN